MFKNHLDIIGQCETPSKKAKFWQSYVRSLKGSEDIRAQESPRSRSYRPYSAYADLPASFKSIFDEPHNATERMAVSGYRYQPVHREIYGYTPRAIYDHHYSRQIPAANYDVEKAWNDHLKRMAEIERRYPSRYGLYLRDKPNTLVPLEYEPEDKPSFSEGARAPSVPPAFSRAASVPPFPLSGRASSAEPMWPRTARASSLEPLDRAFYSKFDNPMPLETSSSSPTPVKPGRWGPRPTEVAYDAEGNPVFPDRNRFRNIFNPSPYVPITAITRDPWWWDLEDLKPFPSRMSGSPFVRDSFLSPVKRNYLWFKHPLRPLVCTRPYY